jgi:hypothetical protein
MFCVGVTYGVKVAEQSGTAASITKSTTGSSATGSQTPSSASLVTPRDSIGLVVAFMSLISIFVGMVMIC